jgi:hypothetical protein
MMGKRLVIITSILILDLSLWVFPQVQPQKPPEEPLPPLAVPKEYRYNARGRRDPFVNPVPKPPAPRGAAPTQAPQCAQGLKGVLVAQAAIAGVVTSREPSMNVVIIGAPGGKTYFARVGDALCDALVKTIKLDAVTFVVTGPGPEGNPQTPAREIVRKVRPSPGEEK